LSDRTWLRGLPKAELHVHLEGTMTPEAYARIARRNGFEVPSDPASLFHCNNFESFLNTFLHVVRALQRPEDLAEITASYLEQSAREGVRHVEFLFSPATLRHFFKGIDLESIVAAIHGECTRARTTHGVSSLLIFDMVRNLGEDAAFADIDLALASKRYGVVGIGLGGDERTFPARDFRRAFERAERMGLRRTVHAGEADGRHSIVDAVELLHAERIGHGVAAAGEEDVLRLLRGRGVAVDVCLTSNTVTGAWNGRGVHPVGEFLRADVVVALSSDDPSFFGASLLDEYERAAHHGLGRPEIIQLARNSFQSSFAPEKEKRAWLDELDAYIATRQARH